MLTDRDYPWLEPPPLDYPLTVVDPLAAGDPGQFAAAERNFAGATWAAWAQHHPTVRRWLQDPGSLPRQRR